MINVVNIRYFCVVCDLIIYDVIKKIPLMSQSLRTGRDQYYKTVG